MPARQSIYKALPDWLIGAFCLAIPALFNSYPLITADSGAYISNGYLLQMPLDRPIAYSVLTRIASMGVTLWGVVAAQALTVSLLLLILARYLLGAAYRLRSFAAIMLTIGTATSAGWFVGQIMPDIFTAILLLSCLILYLIPASRPQRIAVAILIGGCMLMHNSNLLIALLLGAIFFIRAVRTGNLPLRRTGLVLLVTCAVSWITLSTMNAIAGRGFRPSAGSHVFIMSRMVETGMMDEFLDDYCRSDSTAYKLCAYRNRLPHRQWDFMWDTDGPLYKTGGWVKNEPEFNRILVKTLTTPKYLGLHFVKAAHGTLRQLPLLYVGDGLQAYEPSSSPARAIRQHLRSEENEFNTSEQQRRGRHLEWWNPVIIVFSLLAIIMALLLPVGRSAEKAPPAFRSALRVILLFLLINAGVTATLATVIGRYESRVFWVLPFLSILYIVRNLYHRKAAAMD